MALCELALIHNDLLGDRPLDDTEKFHSRVRLPIVLSLTDHCLQLFQAGTRWEHLPQLSQHKAERMGPASPACSPLSLVLCFPAHPLSAHGMADQLGSLVNGTC